MDLTLIALVILSHHPGSEAVPTPTITFLAMIGGGQRGEITISQTTKQAFQEIGAFTSETVQRNQHTMGLEVSVSGPLKETFQLGADFSYTADFMTTSTESSTHSSKAQWEDTMTRKSTVRSH